MSRWRDKPAPEVILERCASVQAGAGTAVLDAAGRSTLLAANESMAKDALRVLGIAYRILPKQDSYTAEAPPSSSRRGCRCAPR